MQKSFLLAALFLLLPLSAIAQEIDLSSIIPRDLDPRGRALHVIGIDSIMGVMFESDASGFFMTLLSFPFIGNQIFPGFREEFGITEEQLKVLITNISQMQLDNTDVLASISKKLAENLDYVLTEDEKVRFDAFHRGFFEKHNVLIANTFTAEKIQKMDDTMFALLGGLESPFLHEKYMAVLELTDEQKEKFKAISKEMKPEQEKILAEFSVELKKAAQVSKLNFKDLEAAGARVKAFTENLKQRRMAILTPTQIAKAAELSKPPKFVTAAVFDKLPKWMPGINSWKPGDPLPAGIVPPQQPQERTRQRPGFPRTGE
jgi:hypothetical protein